MVEHILLAAVLASASHPRLYYTPEDAKRARINIERFDWAKQYFDRIRTSADKWAAMPDGELRALVPPSGSRFAYGFSGCPECGASWPWWGQGGVASWERPGQATCTSCKRTFPDADHPDDGNGWKSPKNGKTYYFVGCYNAFAVQQITLHILRDLSLAYTLTGDGKYSRAAAAVYDALADTYPTTTEGSADYPSDPNFGRLERPQYLVARALVLYAKYLDLLCDSPHFAAPSRSGNGSVRDHIEESVIRDGGRFNYQEAIKGYMGLTNGQADYVRGALVAGVMLGDREWIDCGASGPYRLESFLGNCLDRDGHYYETSVGYAAHAIHLYLDMAEMLYNLRTPEYPNGLDLYKHPRFRQTLFQAGVDFDCFGHFPRFGDWEPDFSTVVSDERFIAAPYLHSELLAVRAGDDAARRDWEAARDWICDGDVESRRASKAADSWREWLLFHAEPVAPASGAPGARPRNEPAPRPVLGGKGAVVLRSGRGRTGRAALMRYGPSNTHGHYDDLNINFYALGRELTYDLGYGLGSAHVQTGWAKHTASHNCVVVNEKSQLGAPGTGGSAYFHADAAPVRAFEASSEASYASEGVDTYRRTIALVDLPGGRTYLLDVFRVAGGNQHDLMWHFQGEMTAIEGADMGPVQAEGSLAGPGIEWGSKVGASGDLIGSADQRAYWNPPPGNGYGFLYNVRRATRVSDHCTATWSVDPKGNGRLALHLLPEPGVEIATAEAPGILPTFPKPDFAIIRRSGEDLASGFVSVLEPYTGDPAITSVSRLECTADPSALALGVRVESAAGTDYIVSAVRPGSMNFRTDSGESISFNGQFGFLRIKDGHLVRGVLVGGTELAIGEISLSLPAAGYVGSVVGVDRDRWRITVDGQLPSDLAGQLAYINGAGYSHNSPYRIESVSDDGRTLELDADCVLGRGCISDKQPEAPGAVLSMVPFPKAMSCSYRPSGYYKGKLMVNDRTGESTTVIDMERDLRTIHVNNPSVFRPGDGFTIFDIREGDEVRIPAVRVSGSSVRSPR